jgi:hypothetical protein
MGYKSEVTFSDNSGKMLLIAMVVSNEMNVLGAG